MATVTLKNIPEKVYSDLKKEAKDNHRSLNGEILFALQLYLQRKRERPHSEEIMRKARELRARVKGSLSAEEIDGAINEGRP
jgi:antitoxin FitA